MARRRGDGGPAQRMAGTGVKLERPDVKYKTSFIAAVQEFQASQTGGRDILKLDPNSLENDFSSYVQGELRLDDPAHLEPGKVLQSEFWLVNDLEFFGRIALRHGLNDFLKGFGGHIGYEIRPSRQRQGLGTFMLKLVLEKAREIKLERVLITCDVENLGSRGVIEANGGELEGEFQLDWYEKPIHRYWINLMSNG
jgi:predicted acetyltransferase